MKSAVIVFPASNCDRDAAVALEAVSGAAPHMVWHGETDLPPVDFILLPGGFSYGDYLRSGAMAARSPIMREVIKAAHNGTPVLGICNGFQVLTESGLLPGVLMRNAGLTFVCKTVHLRVENNETLFTRHYNKGDQIAVPVAHHDGNYFADADTLKDLEDQNRIAFRYVDNPNGSQNDIAGILNANGNVLGMMPHPERVIAPILGGTDGAAMFESILEAVA